MSAQFNIHPDFQKIRGMQLSSSTWLLAIMNGGLHIAAAMKWSKHKSITTQQKIIGADGQRVSMWLIKPENLKTPSPVLFYFHGGAFILKHSPQHIENAVRYAREANCCVIFVDYRLAPKHAFPTPFNDCYAALTWAIQHAEKLGIDAQRIAVGGDSAGGAIAAAVAQRARDEGIKLCGQLLIYPVADARANTQSSTLYADVAPMNRFSAQRMWREYLGHSFENNQPIYASPLHGNLSALSAAYVETTEFDPLHDESLAYAQALIGSGNNVTLNETERTVHGYDLLVPDSAISKNAMNSRIQFLRSIFCT